MELMKSGLSTPAILRISSALSQVLDNFNQAAFQSKCLDNIDSLELKERVKHIITVLHHYLPKDFIQATKVLAAIKPIWDYGNPEDPLRSFAAWPLIDYIADYGISHPKESLDLLKLLTSLFSAEFAIRPFIIKYPEVCHSMFLEWVLSDDENVRRLVSEGTRPRLPWGMQLKPFINDPTPNIPLLNSLYKDSSLYVRRSVANHLNDIAKDHPNVVVDTCEMWSKNSNKDTEWVIKHATRTLIKNGNPTVFSLLGYTTTPKVNIVEFSLSKSTIALGESISFELSLHSTTEKEQKLVVDYAIHFVKANGSTQAKVFKCKNIILKGHDTLSLTKTFSFKPISTRKYYKGTHKLEILLNGKSITILPFSVNE